MISQRNDIEYLILVETFQVNKQVFFVCELLVVLYMVMGSFNNNFFEPFCCLLWSQFLNALQFELSFRRFVVQQLFIFSL